MDATRSSGTRYLIFIAIALSSLVFAFAVSTSIAQAAERTALEQARVLTGSVLPLLISISLLIRERRLRNVMIGVAGVIGLVVIGLSVWMVYGPASAS